MTLGVYELGSIFKVFTAAMALDSGMVAAHETFDTAEPLQIGRYKINDPHGEERPLSIEEIIVILPISARPSWRCACLKMCIMIFCRGSASPIRWIWNCRSAPHH